MHGYQPFNRRQSILRMGFDMECPKYGKTPLPPLADFSSNALALLRDRCVELEDALYLLESSKKEILGQIEQCFQTICRCLEERRKALILDLNQSLEERRTLIEKLMKELEERSQKIKMNVEVIKQANLSKSGTVDVGGKQSLDGVEISAQGARLEEELRAALGLPVPIHPSASDILSYFPIDLDQLLSLIKNFGAIGVTSVDADQTCLKSFLKENSQGVIRCNVNQVTFEKIKAIDCQGRDVELINPDEFTVSLTPRLSNANEAIIVSEVDKNGPFTTNTLGIQLKLYHPGTYDANIKVLGEHIRGSPYRIQCFPTPGPLAKEWKSVFDEISRQAEMRLGPVRKFRRSYSARSPVKHFHPKRAYADKLSWSRNGLLFTVGIRGRGPSEFGCPQGAWFTRDSKILVADSNNANVQVFDATGTHLLRFGDFGADPGQMVRPKDVAETINSNYLVCDFDSHCIHVFQPSGKYMSRFGQRHLAGPSAVSVDSKGRIYVADTKACTVCYFKPTGRYLGQFGSRGTGDNQFSGPVGIAIDSADRIYVTDTPVHCIKVFENGGEFLYKFGSNGLEPGCFHLPIYLCFDSNDLLYVSDSGNSRIQVFDNHGQFLRLLTTPLDLLNEPTGIAVSLAEQMAVVVDSGNFCIKAFQMCDPAAAAMSSSKSERQKPPA
ncbi:hypothetical protein AAHC03_0560 [Spirometra sp. Aus1]